MSRRQTSTYGRQIGPFLLHGDRGQRYLDWYRRGVWGWRVVWSWRGDLWFPFSVRYGYTPQPRKVRIGRLRVALITPPVRGEDAS